MRKFRPYWRNKTATSKSALGFSSHPMCRIIVLLHQRQTKFQIHSFQPAIFGRAQISHTITSTSMRNRYNKRINVIHFPHYDYYLAFYCSPAPVFVPTF